jgi:hypothetical protein
MSKYKKHFLKYITIKPQNGGGTIYLRLVITIAG